MECEDELFESWRGANNAEQSKGRGAPDLSHFPGPVGCVIASVQSPPVACTAHTSI